MRTAICPGSFDPITIGHVDIIKRAASLFDKVIVLIAVNPDKNAAFSVKDRILMIKKATEGLDNVYVDCSVGLIAEYAKEHGACAIVKGLRAVTDFEYEFQMALANKKLYPEAETIFLTTASENMFLSSSVVKQIARFDGDISSFVPEVLIEEIKKGLNNGGNQNGN